MAGIYIHVPFCKSRCNYCDFYSTTNLDKNKMYVDSLLYEIVQKRSYFANREISTIYFGGGTPSLLDLELLSLILKTICDNYKIVSSPEITIEVNPDDVNYNSYLKFLELGINRLSIGVQSFNTDELLFLNRRHTAGQAENAVLNARHAGFSNISVDLIYGIPDSDTIKLKKSVSRLLNLGVQHISAYHLTFEKKTLLYKQLKKRIFDEITETNSLEQFNYLRKELTESGFLHYEISNFALQGFLSRHNSSYWLSIPYLGFGPSAHSYFIDKRIWNHSELAFYASPDNRLSTEYLSSTDSYNEYLMVSLRTFWGIDVSYVVKFFGFDFYKYLMKQAHQYIANGAIIQKANKLYLSEEAYFKSDSIIVDLFYEE